MVEFESLKLLTYLDQEGRNFKNFYCFLLLSVILTSEKTNNRHLSSKGSKGLIYHVT